MGALAQKKRRLRMCYKPKTKTGFGQGQGRPVRGAGYPNVLG